MVFGATSTSVSNSEQRQLDDQWKRFVVIWTPAHSRGSADLGFQTASSQATTYSIDGVSFLDPIDTPQSELAVRPSQSRASRAFELASFASVSSARPVARSETHVTTLAWALGGALTGLVLALVVVGLGQAASSRQAPKQQPHA